MHIFKPWAQLQVRYPLTPTLVD
uniref:Uncharacterized protein n=1 Tax=mine drainage metagenome TaxID=410659 RepID=E6QHB1_9ZZZZ